MTNRRLPTAALPGWPARLDLPLAAAYVSESPSQFMLGVDCGRWPKPMREEPRQRSVGPPRRNGRKGRMYWLRLDLDKALGIVESSSPVEEIDREFGLLGNGHARAAAERPR